MTLAKKGNSMLGFTHAQTANTLHKRMQGGSFLCVIKKPCTESWENTFSFFIVVVLLWCFVLRQSLTLAHIGDHSLLSLGYPQSHNKAPASLPLVWGLPV